MADSATDLLIDIERTKAKLGCGRTKVFKLIGEQQLRSVKIGRKRMVVAASLRELIAKLDRGEVVA
jgi:hypothetical protein